MISLFNTIKEWLPSHRIRPVYVTLSISEFATGLTTPILTFLFFSESSALLPAELSMAERGVLFGLFISLFRFAGMLSNPVFGTLSDMLGRKKIIYISVLAMVCLGLFTILSMIFQAVWVFVIGASIYAFFWALRPVCTAAINDVTDNSKKMKNQALLQFFIGIGVGLGPMLGGWLGNFKPFGYSYMLPFIILLLLSLFLFAYAKLTFPETLYFKNKQDAKEFFKVSNIKDLFNNKIIYLLMIIHILDQFSWGVYYNFMPAVTKTVFGFSVIAVGIFVGLIGIWLIVSTGIIIPILQRYFSNTQLIIVSSVIGTFGVCITYAASFFPGSTLAHYVIWISALPVAAGDVILFCLLLSLFSSYVSKKHQGTIVGIIYIVGTGMWCLAAPIGGYLMKWRMNGALILCPIAMILLLIFLKLSHKRQWFLSLNTTENIISEKN